MIQDPPTDERSTESTNTNAPADADLITDTDLTAFQVECLRCIAVLEGGHSESYGLGVKRELEKRYGEEVNHGRLYPNLDTLVRKGLVEKTPLDKRTNAYRLTDDARRLLVEAVEAALRDIVAFGGHHALDPHGLDVQVTEDEE